MVTRWAACLSCRRLPPAQGAGLLWRAQRSVCSGGLPHGMLPSLLCDCHQGQPLLAADAAPSCGVAARCSDVMHEPSLTCGTCACNQVRGEISTMRLDSLIQNDVQVRRGGTGPKEWLCTGFERTRLARHL